MIYIKVLFISFPMFKMKKFKILFFLFKRNLKIHALYVKLKSIRIIKYVHIQIYE